MKTRSWWAQAAIKTTLMLAAKHHFLIRQRLWPNSMANEFVVDLQVPISCLRKESILWENALMVGKLAMREAILITLPACLKQVTKTGVLSALSMHYKFCKKKTFLNGAQSYCMQCHLMRKIGLILTTNFQNGFLLS